jgi:acetyltransferase-like isoleucine patch superfamily enzyme
VNKFLKTLCCLIPIAKYRRKLRKKLNKNLKEKNVVKVENKIHLNLIGGKYSYIGENCQISENISIGKYCSIGPGVAIGASNHPIDWLTTHPFTHVATIMEDVDLIPFDRFKKTVIENDVWIGQSAIIKNGVTVHNGAIVGAGAIVLKDVPPYAIVVGVPAKIIRYRFNESIIKELQQLCWWDIDEKYIKKLPFDNIEASIKELKKIKRIK